MHMRDACALLSTPAICCPLRHLKVQQSGVDSQHAPNASFLSRRRYGKHGNISLAHKQIAQIHRHDGREEGIPHRPWFGGR